MLTYYCHVMILDTDVSSSPLVFVDHPSLVILVTKASLMLMMTRKLILLSVYQLLSGQNTQENLLG